MTAVEFNELGFDTTGLVGYWQLNGNAHDSSGQDNNGTIVGATATTDRFGTASGAMSFDGVDYVRLATTISLGNTDWTVTAWMKINNAGSNPLLSNWNGGPVTNCLSVLGSKISYGHYLVSWLYENGTSNIEDNRWHFLTWANHSNKTIDLYVDGVIDKAGAISSVSNSGPVNNIGRNWATTANGSIDEVKVFNRALSADEVLFMYNHEKGKFSVGQDGSMQALEFVEDPTLPVQMRSKKESLTVKGQLIEQ